MYQIVKENFSLSQICQSGQCFRMDRVRDSVYRVIAGGNCLEVEQRGEQILFDCDQTEFEAFWKDYFDLDQDYGSYIAQIDPSDTYLMQAAALGSGIRILRQDLWETTVSFLISQQNNIKRIRKCIQQICEQYGESRSGRQGGTYHVFPGPEAFCGLEEDALMACGLGYRSKYVVRCARSVVSGETDLEAVRKMPYQEAKTELMKLYGVGAKVADCICLSALHHLQAFPVDTHISQALAGHYAEGFPSARYEGYQGVLQQYIFYFELLS